MEQGGQSSFAVFAAVRAAGDPALTHQWGSLFVGALFSQPLQLLVIALGLALDAYLPLPFGHLFGLATIYICFRIPGALHSTSAAGRRAVGYARREIRVMTKSIAKAL